MELNDKVGVKKDIERLERAVDQLKKADSPPTMEGRTEGRQRLNPAIPKERTRTLATRGHASTSTPVQQHLQGPRPPPT